MKKEWRGLYRYMVDKLLCEDEPSKCFPTFNEIKHNLLCSELKQLYVVITRTRQRLWLCENSKDLSHPMLDVWKRKELIQIRKFSNQMAQAMKVASSPQEWSERGHEVLI